MKLVELTLLGAAALALAMPPAVAQDAKKGGTKDSDPGFNVLDKDKDGYLSRTEAATNPELAKHFKEGDKDGDGKLSRTEYLIVMTKYDLQKAKEKVSKALEKDKGNKAGAAK